MPERGYRRQVATRAGAAMPLARAETFGAGLGRQVGQSADALHRSGLQDYAVERQATANEEWAGFQHGHALLREDMDRIVREMRKEGGPGHARRVMELYEQRRERLLDGITDDEVRRRASATFQDWGGRLRSSEADFEHVQGVARTLTDWSETQNISANRLRHLEDPAAYPAELQLGHDAIDGLNIPEEQKRRAREDWDRTAAVSYLRGQLDRDPAMAKEMLSAGLFDHLDPDVVDRLLNAADVEIRRAEAEAQQLINMEQSALRQDVRLTRERHSQGIDVSDDLPGLIERARGFGMEVEALDLEGIAGETAFARVYESATPVQREARLAELGGRSDLDDWEQRELKYLRDTQMSVNSQFNADPAGYMSRTASPPPPLDLADPDSVAARSAWARAASETMGRPVPPLTGAEARQIGENWETGRRADQLAVMDHLAQLPPDQATAAARLIEPNDGRLAVMVTLPRSYRQLALDGRDALKANPRMLAVDDVRLEEQMADFDRIFTDALRAVPPAQRDAALQVARQITAGAMDQAGDELTARAYWNGLQMALGGIRRRSDGQMAGGLGHWIDDRWYVLPDGMTADQFGSAVQRAARDGIGAGAVRPVNPDGSPATLSRTYPVAVADGIYEFHTGHNSPVMGDDGHPWRLRVVPR